MDSDYEIPIGLKNLTSGWSNARVSNRVSQTLTSMTSIRESSSMRFSMVTASKWKKMGYHPYKPDAGGYTALHRSAKRGDASVIDSLLAMYDGKPIELASMESFKQKQIALHIASKFGNLEAVRLLAAPEFRTLVNHPDQNGNTALHFAASSNSKLSSSIVALLLLRGADPTIKNQHGVFPIVAHLLTAQNDEPEVVHMLIKYGSNANTIDNAGNTVLQIAVTRGLWKIASCLVRENANMSIKNNLNVSVLDLVTPEQLKYLAKYIVHPPEWVQNQKDCMICTRKFNIFKRRHHCRLCGRVCCGPCSKFKRRVPFGSIHTGRSLANEMVKVCTTCVNVRTVSTDEQELVNEQVDALIASQVHVD